MRSVKSLAIVAIFALLPLVATAQDISSGTITGQITDPSGAVVPGARVTILEAATNASQTRTTNGKGIFFFSEVKPGMYSVTVTAQGFRKTTIPQQQVLIGKQVTLNLTVAVGPSTQEVQVTSAAGAQLQTLNATMGTTLSGNILLNLPNQNRDATSLLVFQPATAPTFGGAEGNITGGEVAGAMADQNTFTLDGGNATDDLAGDNGYVQGNRGYVGPQAAIPTPVESIQEFTINTNNQTANFGTSDGAQVLMLTKRGTEHYHGSAYDYFQGDWLNANGWDNNVVGAPRIKQHQNRFGASLGGELVPGQHWGGKTYFYTLYEGRRYPYANGRFEKTVPSDTLRQGILVFRDANGNPQQYNLKDFDPRGIGLDPLISQFWNKYEPEPNDCANHGDHLNTCGYFAPLSLPVSDNFAVSRLDHDFGANWHFTGTFRFYKLVQPSTNQVDIGGLLPGDTKGIPSSHSGNPQQPRYLTLSVTGAMTPTLTNAFHVSYLRNDWNWIRVGVPNGIMGVPGGLEIGGETSQPLAPMNFDTQNARFRTWRGHDWTYADTASWVKGNHYIQFGGQFTHWWDNHLRPDNVTGSLSQLVYQINKGHGLVMSSAYRPSNLPSSENGSWDSLYSEGLGFVGTASQLFVRGGTDFHLTGASYLQDTSITDQYNLFATDTYKLTPSLTLSYGLEWGVQMPPYEVNGVQDVLTDSSGQPVSYNQYEQNVVSNAEAGKVYNPPLGFMPIRAVPGHPKYPFQTFYKGFSPRFSVAWNPTVNSGPMGWLFGGSNTVLRAGYARLYDRSNAVGLVMTPLLGYGFGQPIRCTGAGINGKCNGTSSTDPTNAFRIGVDGNTAPFPPVLQTLPVPAEPGINTPSASVLFGLDSKWRPGVNDQFDFSIQRQLPNQTVLEVGYIGRWARHLFLGMDANAVPTMLKLGGQTFAQAYYSLWQANQAGTAPTAVAPAPFFETALGSGYIGSYNAAANKYNKTNAGTTGFVPAPTCATATCAVLASEGGGPIGTNNLGTENPFGMFTDMDGSWGFPGCSGCSILLSDTQAAALDMSTTNGYSNYQAAIVSVQKRAGQGLTLSGNFTWSHSLNTIGINQEYVEASPNNIHDLTYDYGPAPWDRRFVLNLLASYELPFGHGNGILDRLIGGWQFAPVFTWATGIPIETYTGSCDEFGGGNIPWCSGAVPLAGAMSAGTTPHMNVQTTDNIGSNNDVKNGGTGGNLFSNPSAVYKEYRAALLGLDTNSYDLGPFHGQHRWDLSFDLAKDTRITESQGITISAQFLNAFNHMMYNDPSMNLQGPGDWGTLTSQYNNPRVIELGLRYHF